MKLTVYSISQELACFCFRKKNFATTEMPFGLFYSEPIGNLTAFTVHNKDNSS